MHKKNTVQSMLTGQDQFMVTVFPNVDFAFIVALIVILNEINFEEEDEEKEKEKEEAEESSEEEDDD